MRFGVRFYYIMIFFLGCRTFGPKSNNKSDIIHWEKGKTLESLSLSDADSSNSRVVTNYLTRYERNMEWNLGNGIETIYRLKGGWACSSTGSSNYSEVGKDWVGKDRVFYYGSSRDFNFLSNSSRSYFEFTSNSMNKNHNLNIKFSVNCTRPGEEFADEMYSSRSMDVYWNCKIDGSKFPKGNGEKIEFTCPREQNTIGTMLNYASSGADGIILQQLNSHDARISVLKMSEHRVFDYNNCKDKTTKPFYIRITQGLSGWLTAKRFRLNVIIDGKDSPKLDGITSTNGIYTLALAYCPKEEKEFFTVELDAIEEDWFTTSGFRPLNPQVSLRRGEIKIYELHKDKTFKWVPTFIAGHDSSFVRIESLGVE